MVMDKIMAQQLVHQQMSMPTMMAYHQQNDLTMVMKVTTMSQSVSHIGCFNFQQQLLTVYIVQDQD